ncbi:hypothetical protein EPUL_005278 [Erysiphe pulchra]|uniref:BHLH domain-containing protein n=1 Tax=Erysiphe pulchra TaxID=225359 RepID=A0A2S4PME6_9PEZI|nr:hypothetical protein EPUL_005278 [Erysiphe pulchra]
MGPSKPPSQELPFGCILATLYIDHKDSFNDSGINHPFPSPTAPAPGPSLLDDNESRLLDNFFDGVSSDQFNYDVFNTDNTNNLEIGWDEMPPNIIVPSYGQLPQPGSHGGILGLDFGHLNTQIIPGSATVTNELLQVADLSQNTPQGRPYSLPHARYFRSREDQILSSNRPSGTGLAMITRPVVMLQPVFESRSNVECYSNEPDPAELIFDGHSTALMRNRGVNARTDIRWGSDVAFAAPQGFTTPSSRESVSAAERYHLQTIETAFSLSPSYDPVEETRRPPPAIRHSSISHQCVNSATQNCNESDQSRGLSTNRRRNIESQEEDEDEDSLSTSVKTSITGSRKRKSEVNESIGSSALGIEARHRRKRSSTSVMKSTRENLSEEQKRENHIRSEQKRRTLIREGFEDLNELVPGLKGGGFSKSAVLAQTADWLENLIRGNENLRKRILMMEGQVKDSSQ